MEFDWSQLFGSAAGGGGGGGGGKTTSATSGVSLNSSYGSDVAQYVPWIVGGVALVLVIAIVFLFTGKNK